MTAGTKKALTYTAVAVGAAVVIYGAYMIYQYYNNKNTAPAQIKSCGANSCELCHEFDENCKCVPMANPTPDCMQILHPSGALNEVPNQPVINNLSNPNAGGTPNVGGTPS